MRLRQESDWSRQKNTGKFDTSQRIRKQLKINYSKATIFKTLCHPRMMLRVVINSRGLIRRRNCSRKRTLPQKLVPWSKLYIAHSRHSFDSKQMLTTIQKATLCIPNYNTLNDDAISVILFSDVVFTVFDSDKRIRIECNF